MTLTGDRWRFNPQIKGILGHRLLGSHLGKQICRWAHSGAGVARGSCSETLCGLLGSHVGKQLCSWARSGARAIGGRVSGRERPMSFFCARVEGRDRGSGQCSAPLHGLPGSHLGKQLCRWARSRDRVARGSCSALLLRLRGSGLGQTYSPPP